MTAYDFNQSISWINPILKSIGTAAQANLLNSICDALLASYSSWKVSDDSLLNIMIDWEKYMPG